MSVDVTRQGENHEFMNKCDCICILDPGLLSISLSRKDSQPHRNQTKSVEYYSILSFGFRFSRSVCIEGNRREKKESEHDEDSSWLATFSEFSLPYTHSSSLLGALAHNTKKCEKKLPLDSFNSPDTRRWWWAYCEFNIKINIIHGEWLRMLAEVKDEDEKTKSEANSRRTMNDVPYIILSWKRRSKEVNDVDVLQFSSTLTLSLDNSCSETWSCSPLIHPTHPHSYKFFCFSSRET